MTTMAIVGNKGSGKTLLATAMAANDGRRILSNYVLRLPNYAPVEPEDLYSITEPTLVILDEAYTWLESRVSGNVLNRYLSYILFQSRKRQIDFILTAQMFETVDRRFRGQTDIYVEADPTVFAFVYRFMAPGRKPRTMALARDVAEKYFPLYDTLEVVDPLDDEMLYEVCTDPTKAHKEAERVLAELLEISPAITWTQAAIDGYCMEKGYYRVIAKMVWGKVSLLKTIEKSKKLAEKELPKVSAAGKKIKPRKVV